MIYRKTDDILLDILRWKVYEKFVSINLHVAKLVHLMANNILILGRCISNQKSSNLGVKTGGNHAGDK
jgi:hypothetical protein